MIKIAEQRSSMLHGVLLITLFACAAFYIGDTAWVKTLSLSPLVVGIILGMLYANSLRNNLPDTWVPGIAFCSKRILRLGIILYGFKLTFQDVAAVGLAAIVLGVDGAIRPKPYKTAVAVATVVIFGTIAMFLYPALWRSGLTELSAQQMGIWTGATVHEVAHVVGASNPLGDAAAGTAIIVKMIRVMMLVPVLLILAWAVARNMGNNGKDTEKTKINVPWFAVLYLAVIGFNSLDLLPAALVNFINNLDTFLLTMAMAALGAETSIEKFKKAGAKPFLLTAILFVWLTIGGYCMVRWLVPLF